MDLEGKPNRILVLYASQTGNAMDVAERIGREAERCGCSYVEVLSMDSFDANCLPKEGIVIFVVSTTGQGDNPDPMKVFWRFLLQRHLGNNWLKGLQYAVFGLGDSGYQKYNFAAKKLDKRLIDLGAKPIIHRGLGDDQHRAGYEGVLDPWLISLWKMLNGMNSAILPRISAIYDTNRTLEHPKYKVKYHSTGLNSDFPTSKDFNTCGKMIEMARLISPLAQQIFGDNRPDHFLQMVKNERLTKADSSRDLRHFEFEFLTPGAEYHVGDVLEILPTQNPVAVDAFIKRCNLDPNSYITVHHKESGRRPFISHADDFPNAINLRAFVALTMDVASASPRRYFFEVMSFFAAAVHEKERLQYFASSEGRDDLYQYNQKERRTVLEVLEDFLPFKCHLNVHITVSVVSWISPYKRTRHGLCSTWLAGLHPRDSKEIYIPVWIHHGSLPQPAPMLPLILIGPGTGCAPFRAFIEERAVQKECSPIAPTLFFFGCRNQEKDFIYKDFWLSHAQSPGVLSAENGGGFFVAFSRDQPTKMYVQHKMKEESARIWSLLSSGAAIYLAGSSTKMPADVTSTVEEIIAQESGSSKDSAARWLKLLERSGKFHIEAWS
ncbi:hypothetical protein HPP92_005180 [Vanilla planifolia]|uniref:NADPH-dependent FMN and FAD-containing oxidoreductase n=1 Tax=Vanilla planifolia TaxID=51239 RepID=A0A835VF49_VANPL|nr:hypothetical protein HPP92_005180 [Vanilla planifolia]